MPADLVLQTALRLIERGFRVNLLHYRTKVAADTDWPNLILSPEDIQRRFAEQPYNLGIVWNSRFADVDLDSAEARKLARWFLPATGMIFGRRQFPQSHFVFRIDQPLDARIEFKDPCPDADHGEKAMLIEIRTLGGYTMAPGSIHPDTGETIEYYEDEDPTLVDPLFLKKQVGICAAAALVARRWGRVNRHWTSLHLAGAMLKSGFSAEQIHYFFTSLFDSGSVQDEERYDRLRTIQDTVTRYEEGDPVTGWPAVVEQLGEETTNAIREWLGIGIERPRFHTTDEGNAQRFVDKFGGVIRYCPDIQKWFVWDRRRWEIDPDESHVGMMARETVRFIYVEAQEEEDLEYRAMLGKWAASSESASHILSILKLAKYDPQIIIPISALDMNPWLFNCQNGTLDLRSGELRPFSQLDYITKISNFDYEEGTQSYMWDTFLRHVMQENDEMIAFLQRAVGYCMTGLTHEDCFFLPWGPTRTGKSTFIHAIEKVFGDYGQSTRPEVFMRKNSDPIPNEIAALQGIRLSTSVETEGGQQLAVSQMKRLTGGEAIRARFMYREFFQFTPTFHIWIATNNRPVIPGNDSAIWERLRLIPFTNPFTLDIRDRDFRERLPIEAGKAILAWMVEGCKKWQERGLGVPPLISEAIESYREDMDDIAQFIDEICVKDANSTVLASQLYDAFTLWARMKNIPRLSLPQFKDDLLSRGYNQTRTSRGFIWRGLKLTNTVIELGDAASGAPVL